MLKITTSPNCKAEKEYIISVLVQDFSGLEYELEFENSSKNYLFEYKNKYFEVNDSFFKNFKENEYLKSENIPSTITFADFGNHKNLPIIFGGDTYEKSDEKITVGLDIFASAFFMLTRWEELFLNKDKHGRCISSEQLSIKQNFHHRPVVNEYCELLWQLLLAIGIPQNHRKDREFGYKFSHDVDHPLLFQSFGSFLKQTGHQLIKKQNIRGSLKFVNRYVSSKNDPYDTFDFLMDLSEIKGSISQFNFMCTTKSTFDEGYDLNSAFNKQLIQKVKDRGHQVGFHPSYETYKSSDLWVKEKQNLEKIVGLKISKGRQHYLRFENPTTWSIWDENKMEEDSSLGFADNIGFRAGVCYAYHPFDVQKRKKLEIKELPLILMDMAVINGLSLKPEEFVKATRKLESEVKKYNGTFTVLWHNSTFFLSEYVPFAEMLGSI